jgi:hypothetical protein
MKTLLLLLLATNAMADCQTTIDTEMVTATTVITTDVPAHLKGATITIRLANGKESSVPAELFKVVPRKRQEVVLEKTQNVNTVCTNTEIATNKNRVSALGGYGSRNKLATSTTSTTVEVENSRGLVGGLQYQRLITDELSIGAQAQTNKTGLLLIGLDF